MKKMLLSAALVLVILAVSGVSCGTSEQAPGTGILKLYLSDAPLDAENVTGVYITVNESNII